MTTLCGKDDIVNLTVPAAHFELNKRILEAGKHVYCEKPLVETKEEADILIKMAKERNLLISSAPETFLGAGIQTCRKLIDENAIGKIVGFTINFVSPGNEYWHANPLFYYQKGGGPMRDMGPYYLAAMISLFGPVSEVACFDVSPRPTRTVHGVDYVPEVPTHYNGIVRMKNGAIGSVNMSWEVWNSVLPRIEIYGTEGMIVGPDPNSFCGPVKIIRSVDILEQVYKVEGPKRMFNLIGPPKQKLIEEVKAVYPEIANMRGIGIQEMAKAIKENRPNRASPELARHIVDILNCMERSSEESVICKLETTCERPEPFNAIAEGCWEGGGEGRPAYL